jgi:hypothetical protein
LTFCTISVIFNVFSIGELPSSFIGAALGALISAVATSFLVKGQSEADELKERNVKVFEKKSEIFQDYINKLWIIWSDHKITSEEYEELVKMYYSGLLMYLSHKDSVEKINKSLVEIGDFLDEETFGERYNLLRESIISIINSLSAEIGLGGKIEPGAVNDLDKNIFPSLFKRELIKAFNKAFDTNIGVLKEGEWQEWKEDKKNTHECMTFAFKKYPEISIKFCFTSENTILPFLIVPHGAKFHVFDEFRPSQTGVTSQRIILDPDRGWINILKPNKENVDDDDMIIPFFDIKDDKNLQEEIMKKDYHTIIGILAKRGAYFLSETRIKIGNGEKSIYEFLEEMNG